MIDQTNPAGRLYKILHEIKLRSDNELCLNAWAEVIGCPQNDLEVTLAVMETYDLSQEVQSLIMMHESINKALYLQSFAEIEKVFFPLNLNFAIQMSKAHLTEEAMTRLQFCSEALSHTYSELLINQDDLAKISQMVSLLNTEIGNAQIPEPIKLELIKEVEKVKRAVQFYVIRGAKGLKESANGLLGTVISSNETLNRIEDKHLLFKIGQLIRKMNSVSSKALKVKSIDAKINALLPKIDPNKPFARRKK